VKLSKNAGDSPSIQTYWTSLVRLQQVKYKNGEEMSGEKSEDDDVTTTQMTCRKSEK
jgi:hypothetical protein